MARRQLRARLYHDGGPRGGQYRTELRLRGRNAAPRLNTPRTSRAQAGAAQNAFPDPSLQRAPTRVSRRTPQTGRPSPATSSDEVHRQAGMLCPGDGGQPR